MVGFGFRDEGLRSNLAFPFRACIGVSAYGWWLRVGRCGLRGLLGWRLGW